MSRLDLQSNLLARIPGVLHGFGTLAQPLPAIFQPRWEEDRQRWRQVHGTRAVRLDGPAQDCGEVDALYSATPGLPVAVMTADCVPVLLARRSGGKVAAVHAGWRGTRAHILTELWKTLAAEGERPANWVAAIGPAIGPCCYEVSEELARDFAAEFSGAGEGVAVPRHRILDLPAINAHELRTLGLVEVDLIRSCTRCSLLADGQPRFHSFRREGGGTRQFSVLQIQ